MNKWWKIKIEFASEITQCLLFGFCCHHTEINCIFIGTLSSTKCRNGWKVKPNTLFFDVEMSNDCDDFFSFFSQRAQWHSNHKTLQTIFVRYVRRRKKKKERIVYFWCEGEKQTALHKSIVQVKVHFCEDFISLAIWELCWDWLQRPRQVEQIALKLKWKLRTSLGTLSLHLAYSRNFYLFSRSRHVCLCFYEYIIWMISRIYGNQFLFALPHVIRSIITNDKVKEQPSLSHMLHATRLIHTFS